MGARPVTPTRSGWSCAAPGGKQGVRRALKELFGLHPMTFSGYGNPYQLWFAGFEVESLGDKRYEVTGQAAGARVHLGDELERFLDHLQAGGMLADDAERAGVVDAYLEGYQSEVRRTVGRYRSRLRRSGENEHS